MGVSLKAEMKIMPFPLISFLTDLHCGIGPRDPFEFSSASFQIIRLAASRVHGNDPPTFAHSRLVSFKINVSPVRDGRSQVNDLPPHHQSPDRFL